MFGKTKNIHFIGIGGIGMSGMAELLHKIGFNITGSDQIKSERIINLQNLGIKISIDHSSNNIQKPDVVVYSSAVNLNNPEIIEAEKKNIPVIRRAEMLSELLKVKLISIAVAGTHGKTTTCSMIGEILTVANLQPTLVIGGIVNKFQSNTISGDGNIIVVEADEFDRSFLSLKPTLGTITNLDLEHLDCYENLDDLQNAFTEFSNSIPFYGKMALCIDNNNVNKIIPKIKRPLITFGIENLNAEIRAENLSFNNNNSKFDLLINNKNNGEINIQVPGKHNIMNALSAISIAIELEIPIDIIKIGLNQYSGVRRRFEIKYITKNDTMIIDDYAHHPSEVEATLNAAKSGWKKRIIAIFQPHLFSRTRDFYKEFAISFLQSDLLIITDIYPAREEPIEGINSKIIADETKRIGHKNVTYISNQNDIAKYIKTITQPNDLIITMGAGNIWRQCEKINQVIGYD